MAQQDFASITVSTDLVNAILTNLVARTQTNRQLAWGPTEPSATDPYMWWMDTSSGAVLKMRSGADSAWITILPDATATGGGLVTATAAAFTTAAPTSAVAATGTTHLTRKAEVDARELHVVVPLGTVSGSDNFYVMGGAVALTVVDAVLISETATTSDASNKWAVQLANITDTLDLRSSDYDTNAHGDLAANTPLDLALDQNLSVGADKVLQLQLAITGSPGALTQALLVLKYKVAT